MSPADALTAAHLRQSHKQEWKDDDARRKQADSGGGRPRPDVGLNVPRLVQSRAAEALQIVLSVGVLLDRHLVCDPRERNIGLRTAKLQQ
jgi:hypothetical protein